MFADGDLDEMESSIHPPAPLITPLPERLAVVALCLLAAYPLLLLRSALPLRLMQPAWQLTVANSLIDHAPVALIGVALLYLSHYLDPLDEQRRNILMLIARLAIPVSLAFVLLIPLRAFNLWQISNLSSNIEARKLEKAASSIVKLREVLAASTSTADLVQRMQAIQAPPLPPLLRQQPFEVIRREMAGSIGQMQAVIDRRRRQQQAILAEPQNLLLTNLRMMLLSFVYGVAFAAAGQRSSSSCMFLTELMAISWRREPIPEDTELEDHDFYP